MRLALDPRLARLLRRMPRSFPYTLAEIVLLTLLAGQVARILWAAVAPIGPVGNWKVESVAPAGDPSLLTRFDPFFRLTGSTGPAVVTSLAIKLFGIRVDQAAGRGSAIIATPDGVQSSYAVGDEIVPGVKLKSVSFDSVTIDRGGIEEQVFLDQSVAAPLAQPVGQSAAPPGAAAPAPPAAALASDVAYAPRLENGQVTGFVVSPKGTGTAFQSAGLQPGDVLTGINGQAITSVDELMTAMKATPASGLVSMSVERRGKAMTLTTQASR